MSTVPSTVQCAECGMTGTMVQTEIAQEISVTGPGVYHRNTVLTVYQESGFWGVWAKRSEVAALVCTNCGFIQLFAKNPQGLKGSPNSRDAQRAKSKHAV